MLALAGCEEKENKPEANPVSKIESVNDFTENKSLDIADYDRLGSFLWNIDLKSEPDSFAECYKNADFVGRIIITDYLGNCSFSHGNTAFKAKIQKCYKRKADADDVIYLLQYGQSNGEMEVGYPLFNIGDDFIACFKLFDGKTDEASNKYYEIMNGKYGITDVHKYNGTDFAIVRGISSYLKSMPHEVIDGELKNAVIKSFIERDSVRENIRPISKVIRFKDFENCINNLT